MEGTPKLQRKSSLSLSSRLNKKRHSASPKNSVKSSSSTSLVNGREVNANCDVGPRSPSMYSVCSDGGIECTPPHKKSARGAEEATDSDYSPQVFDSSFSPSCFLSQTMCVDSPEVGWKWKSYNDNVSRTPDSAYAADSSFTSAGSSSTEVMINALARRDNYKKRRASDARKDREFRRVQKTAAEEKLKQRCAKLQEQLRSAGALFIATDQIETMANNSRPGPMDAAVVPSDKKYEFKVNSPISVSDKLEEKTRAAECENNLDDFFNDSDDYFLLAATQEIELKIKASPSPNGGIDSITSMSTAKSNNTKACCNDNNISASTSNPISTTSAKGSRSSTSCALPICTTSSPTKEKRSSFYMKFLEDDCTDDWFISLDEAVLEATQSKKPRTSLQRYKSMPTNSNDAKVEKKCTVSKSDALFNVPAKSLAGGAGPSSETQLPKIKRHSSSNALSSASSNYRDRQNRLKK